MWFFAGLVIGAALGVLAICLCVAGGTREGDFVNERRIMFGKYKGRAISECPVEYLDRLIGQDWLAAELKEEIENYLMNCPEWRRM